MVVNFGLKKMTSLYAAVSLMHLIVLVLVILGQILTFLIFCQQLPVGPSLLFSRKSNLKNQDL